MFRERMPNGVAPGSSPCDHLDPEDWRGHIFGRGRDLVAGGSVSMETVSLISHRHVV